MRLLDFIFYLIGRFNLLTKNQYTDLYNELDTDWAKVQDDPSKEGYVPGWKAKVKSMERSPYRRLLLAILALPAVKWITDWQLSKPEEEEPEEEEEEMPNPLNRIKRIVK